MNRRDFLKAASVAAVAPDAVGRRASAQPARKTRVILLGTAGGPLPKVTRAAPASVVIVNNTAYVVDCGNGVARQLVLAGIPLNTIRHVFITHHTRTTTPTTARCCCWRGPGDCERGSTRGDHRRSSA